MRESAEQAVVAKRARVVEEVRVGKRVDERDEVVEDTLRRKDVEVQRLDEERERAVASGRREPLAGEPRDPDATPRTPGRGRPQ